MQLYIKPYTSYCVYLYLHIDDDVPKYSIPEMVGLLEKKIWICNKA